MTARTVFWERQSAGLERRQLVPYLFCGHGSQLVPYLFCGHGGHLVPYLLCGHGGQLVP